MMGILTIAGCDYSVNSPSKVIMELDNNYHITNCRFLAFAKNGKHHKTFSKLYPEYSNYIPRLFIIDKDLRGIAKYVMTGDLLHSVHPAYIAFEDYAFGASGAITKLAEAASYQKALCFKAGAKIRHYDIASIKKAFTGHGNSDKITMYDSYLVNYPSDPLGLKKAMQEDWLPEIDKGTGVSPTSDIIDAFAICEMLRLELKLRAGIVELKNLPEHQRSIFLRVTKSNPVNLLAQDFEHN